jgi:histidinol-phosphate/aromatic aminotransferase/cobyric acid decarboxylase-like protein
MANGEEMGAIAAFENYDDIRRDTLIPLMRERTRLYELMSQIPWLSPSPSQANFILARVSSFLLP